MEIADPILKSDVAAVFRQMSYIELRDLARDLCSTATARADPAEELGGFDIENVLDWQELLADWAEAN